MAGTARTIATRRVWLLEIEVGSVLRYSTEEVAVDETVGLLTDTLIYREGLTDPGLSLATSAGRGDVEVSVEIVASDISWRYEPEVPLTGPRGYRMEVAELIAKGVPLEGRRATLLRHRLGDAYERAEVVLRGRISSISYGNRNEPVGLTIRRSLEEVAATLPPPQAVIDLTTWPDGTVSYEVPEESVGHYYPIIVGSPGYNADGDAYAAIQVYYAQYFAEAASYIPVGDGTIAATTARVYVRDEPNATPLITTPDDRTVSQMVDLLGRTLSVITVENAGAGIQIWRDVRLFVGFNAASGAGVTHRGAAIRGAGDVLRWVLAEHLDYPIDWPRVDAVVERLNAYKIDAAILEPVNVWEWLQAEVLPLLPIVMRDSPAGLYPHLWRWGATARDATAHLDGTLGTGRVSRSSSVTTEQGEIYNEITVEYGKYANEDAYRFRRVASSEARAVRRSSSPTDDDRIRGSSLLSDSQRQYGLRPLQLQCAAVWDHATAELILRDKVLAHAFSRRRVSYEGGQWLEALQIGEVVTVTDPEVWIEAEPALVMDVIPSGDVVSVDLLLIDSPRNRPRQV